MATSSAECAPLAAVGGVALALPLSSTPIPSSAASDGAATAAPFLPRRGLRRRADEVSAIPASLARWWKCQASLLDPSWEPLCKYATMLSLRHRAGWIFSLVRGRDQCRMRCCGVSERAEQTGLAVEPVDEAAAGDRKDNISSLVMVTRPVATLRGCHGCDCSPRIMAVRPLLWGRP